MIADSSYNFAFSTSGKFTSRDAKKKRKKKKKGKASVTFFLLFLPFFLFPSHPLGGFCLINLVRNSLSTVLGLSTVSEYLSIINVSVLEAYFLISMKDHPRTAEHTPKAYLLFEQGCLETKFLCHSRYSQTFYLYIMTSPTHLAFE